jgi:DNA replication protein DnaC
MSSTPQSSPAGHDATVLLTHHLKALRLTTFLREYDKQARQCATEGVDYPRYLLRLAELELIERERRIVDRRIKAARFPAVKFEVFSQRYERGSVIVTSNLPFDEWTNIFGSQRLTGVLLDRLTHHVHILEMNGESYRLAHSKSRLH